MRLERARAAGVGLALIVGCVAVVAVVLYAVIDALT